MAVALATLPLKSELAGEGEALFATGSGTALPTALTGLAAGFADAAAFLATGFATGFSAFLATGWLLPAGLLFLATIFFVATFFAAALAGAFTAAAFFGCGLVATLPVAFFATGFFATGLATGFFTTAFFATAFFATTFFAAALAGAALPTARPVFAAFAGALAALFTARPFAATVFDLPALTSFALAAVVPFFCALAAVELRVVFAISLHRFWPWRPGVIAQLSYTGKRASGILVPLHAASRSGNVNVLTRLILWLLRLYKRWLSPLLGQRCRFHPSCSDYARIAVTRFGPWRGSLLAGWRLLRCQPLCTGGEDPVPEHFHYPPCHCRDDGDPPQQ